MRYSTLNPRLNAWGMLIWYYGRAMDLFIFPYISKRSMYDVTIADVWWNIGRNLFQMPKFTFISVLERPWKKN